MFGEIETFIYTHGRLDKELKTTASPPAWTESGAGAVGQGDGVRRRGHDGEDDPPLGKCVIDREATRNESVTWSAAYRVEIAAGVVGRLGGGPRPNLHTMGSHTPSLKGNRTGRAGWFRHPATN